MWTQLIGESVKDRAVKQTEKACGRGGGDGGVRGSGGEERWDNLWSDLQLSLLDRTSGNFGHSISSAPPVPFPAVLSPPPPPPVPLFPSPPPPLRQLVCFRGLHLINYNVGFFSFPPYCPFVLYPISCAASVVCIYRIFFIFFIFLVCSPPIYSPFILSFRLLQ